MTAAEPKLSDAQRDLLWRIVEGGDDGIVIRGRGEHASFYPLAKHGLVGPMSRFCGKSVSEATPAGRALVDTWRCASCGHVDYHCPASGCNHADKAPPDPNGDADEGEEATVWCACETFVSRDPGRTSPKNGGDHG